MAGTPKEYEGASEVDLERAIAGARTAQGRAVAPYSDFPVGAAALDETGALHVGCNVESASFGLTLCAERSALAAWAASGSSGATVTLIAIRTDAATPTPPCGACRQWIAEFAPGAVVVSEARGGARARWSARELLPEPFTDLQRGRKEGLL